MQFWTRSESPNNLFSDVPIPIHFPFLRKNIKCIKCSIRELYNSWHYNFFLKEQFSEHARDQKHFPKWNLKDYFEERPRDQFFFKGFIYVESIYHSICVSCKYI